MAPDSKSCRRRFVFFLVIAAVLSTWAGARAADLHQWSSRELATLKSLWIGSLPPLPAPPSNRYATDPRAAALGKKFFFDTRFSGNMKVSCATCHREDYSFTDNLPRSHGLGETPRRSMPLIGVGYNPFFFWDGRKDSLWAQALGPIENRLEHGISRTRAARIVSDFYRDEFEAIFGAIPDALVNRLPGHARPADDDPEALKAWVLLAPGEREAVNRIYANFGKAVAAYVRTILPQASRFDRYVEALLQGDVAAAARTYSEDEAAGLRLFIGRAKCTNCHNGPMLTNGDFHNLGIPEAGQEPEPGRAAGIQQLLADEFNCLGPYSDATAEQCLELRFLETDASRFAGAFKTPTLRNVADRPPYMNAGQFATLAQVLEFYAGAQHPELGHQGLSAFERRQLEAFLRTLSSPLSSL